MVGHLIIISSSEILDFIINVGPIYIFEILAAIAGTYYLKKGATNRITRWLVIWLWVTVFVEIVCSYAPVAYFSNYQYFSIVKDTRFEDSSWIFNIYVIANLTFFILYFASFVKGRLLNQIIKYSAILYVLASLMYLFITDVYFIEISQFSSIAGTLLLLTVIVLFYFQLLKSDTILNLKYFLPFYISIGVLIFSLCITPFDIFSEYYSKEYIIFWRIKKITFLLINVFMYSSFILGFIICRRKKLY
jgi:hypothetical protein